MSGQGHAAATLTPGGWVAPELVWIQRLEEKSFASAGDRTLVAQTVARHYTDWTTSAYYVYVRQINQWKYGISQL
jgi:hypothetical protein